MSNVFSTYLKVLRRRDFFFLSLIIFFGQAASAFLVLALIVSVFLKTGSNLGVSGVVLSLTIPSFLFMAFAGLAADIFDRRKIIILANLFIALVVLVIILNQSVVYASISLAFLYFAGNSFFIPASGAATAQLVSSDELLVANSIFIFNLASGVLLGLFASAIVYFFSGSQMTLIVCDVLLVIAAVLSFFLPKLNPVAKPKERSISLRIKNIWKGFDYVFRSERTMLFFFVFSAIQGAIFFGITLGPGFFVEIVGFSLKRTILIIFPLIAIGVLGGVFFTHRPKTREFMLLYVGNLVFGLGLVCYSVLIKLEILSRFVVQILSAPFLIALGFGVILTMIGSRTALQKKIPHTHQGTVFGANIILATLIASIASPVAAISEVVFGYLGTLFGIGTILISSSGFFWYLSRKWK